MKNRIIKIFFTVAALISAPTVSADQLSVNQEQIDHLGIQLAKPKVVNKSPLFRAPAKVSIPPSLDFIVSTPHAGLIDRIEISEGEPVEKGQLLARIFSPGFLELQRDYLSSLSEQEMATMRLEHDQMLFKEGVISKHRLIETGVKFNKFNTLYNEHKQLLKMGGMSSVELSQLTRKRKLHNYLKLRSPIDGVVLENKMVAGQQVERLAAVFRVASLKKLYVEIAVPQEKISELSIDDYIETEQSGFQGKIILIGRNVDPESQTVLVRAVIGESPVELRPGQNVSVQLFKQSLEPLYRVPTAAIFRSGKDTFLFARTTSGFEVRKAKVVGQNSHGLVLKSGIVSGEQLVVKGTAALKLLWLETNEGD